MSGLAGDRRCVAHAGEVNDNCRGWVNSPQECDYQPVERDTSGHAVRIISTALATWEHDGDGDVKVTTLHVNRARHLLSLIAYEVCGGCGLNPEQDHSDIEHEDGTTEYQPLLIVKGA